MTMQTFVPGQPDRSGRPPGDPTSSLVLDLLAERFDAGWRDEKRPAIEDFLGAIVEARRSPLFRILLRIELDWRQRRLETHTLAEYLARFPQYRQIVTAEFRPPPPAPQVGFDPEKSTDDTDLDWLTPLAGVPVVGGSPPLDPLLATGRLGNYELLAEVARGGMGVVYRARQAGLGRIVALKMILDRSLADDELRRRFRREAEAAGRLSHPGLVPIYEYGEFEGRLYYSMEFIEGKSLEQLAQRGPLPPHDAARILADVSEAVHYAHQHGIVHRDLKPSNILIDELGRPRVADFGLARHATEGLGTAPGQVLGTPSYMPPEQAAGDVASIGPLSDVYSLGATLYHVLTGRPPFLTATRHGTMQQVLSAAPVPPSRLDAGIPAELERICLRCLEKPPARRYPSAAELSADLRRVAGRAATAVRPRPARRLSQWLVRWLTRD